MRATTVKETREHISVHGESVDGDEFHPVCEGCVGRHAPLGQALRPIPERRRHLERALLADAHADEADVPRGRELACRLPAEHELDRLIALPLGELHAVEEGAAARKPPLVSDLDQIAVRSRPAAATRRHVAPPHREELSRPPLRRGSQRRRGDELGRSSGRRIEQRVLEGGRVLDREGQLAAPERLLDPRLDGGGPLQLNVLAVDCDDDGVELDSALCSLPVVQHVRHDHSRRAGDLFARIEVYGEVEELQPDRPAALERDVRLVCRASKRSGGGERRQQRSWHGRSEGGDGEPTRQLQAHVHVHVCACRSYTS
mmetsp:Transcript_4127/g.12662  ORF Transcript_4127/g.12662 Transcript_4127/m.12662 type:complete len:315 (-) Transcript_4127:20-964(-)